MAIVRKHQVRVVDCVPRLPDLFTVRFRTDGNPFRFRAGQFLHVALDPYDPSRGWPESRCFSIQSPPNSSQQTLAISFSVKGAFTERMAKELVPEKEVWLKLPYGELLQDAKAEESLVFLAGGTGVTPFLSLFLDESFRSYPSCALYLGIRQRRYHVFAPELEQAQRQNPHFRVDVLEEDQRGRIPTREVVERHGMDSLYFVSGPPAMIAHHRTSLGEAGVNLDRIRTDDWG